MGTKDKENWGEPALSGVFIGVLAGLTIWAAIGTAFYNILSA